MRSPREVRCVIGPGGGNQMRLWVPGGPAACGSTADSAVGSTAGAGRESYAGVMWRKVAGLLRRRCSASARIASPSESLRRSFT